jgi:hypothetical protein
VIKSRWGRVVLGCFGVKKALELTGIIFIQNLIPDTKNTNKRSYFNKDISK